MRRGFLLACAAVLLLPLGAAANPELLSLQTDDTQWAIPSKNYAITRYSTLSQITTENVTQLKSGLDLLHRRPARPRRPAARRRHHMYVHSAFPNHIYALDLSKEGAPIKWKYTPRRTSAPSRSPAATWCTAV